MSVEASYDGRSTDSVTINASANIGIVGVGNVNTSLVLGDNYELSFTDRRQAVYPKEMLIEPVPEGLQPTPRKTEPGVYTRSVPEMKDPSD
jgi:hypothetical protein